MTQAYHVHAFTVAKTDQYYAAERLAASNVAAQMQNSSKIAAPAPVFQVQVMWSLTESELEIVEGRVPALGQMVTDVSTKITETSLQGYRAPSGPSACLMMIDALQEILGPDRAYRAQCLNAAGYAEYIPDPVFAGDHANNLVDS